jgi:uncharacterized protein YbjQ (UPF0145 family)
VDKTDFPGVAVKPNTKDCFTGDLSLGEFVALKDASFEPVRFVTGSCIYNIGHKTLKVDIDEELVQLGRIMMQARMVAIARMVAVAADLKADGIIGVNLSILMKPWGENIAEFLAVGSAVRSISGDNFLNTRNRPFTTNLKGEDLFTLLKTGYRPLTYILGNCIFQIGNRPENQRFTQTETSSEMSTYTQMVADSRDFAHNRMRAEGVNFGSDGIVNVAISENSFGWNNHITEYLAAGTCVIAIAK